MFLETLYDTRGFTIYLAFMQQDLIYNVCRIHSERCYYNTLYRAIVNFPGGTRSHRAKTICSAGSIYYARPLWCVRYECVMKVTLVFFKAVPFKYVLVGIRHPT